MPFRRFIDRYVSGRSHSYFHYVVNHYGGLTFDIRGAL
jgi:hypothetical protein